MSDFLSRLAERLAGRSPSIRPRVPGLFEPGGAGPPAHLSEVGESLEGEAPSSRIVGPSDSDPARAESHGDGLVTADRVHPAPRRAADRELPAETTRRFAPQEPSLPAESRPRAPETTIPPTKRALAAAGPEAGPPAVLSGAPSLRSPLVSTPFESPARPAPAEGGAPTSSVTPTARVFMARPSAPSPTRETAATGPLVSTHRGLRTRAASRPETKVDTEPVIQVSIGRIDVRAVPPAAARSPRRQSKVSQPSRLDEYQRRRSKESA